jgi:hypothetical protein
MPVKPEPHAKLEQSVRLRDNDFMEAVEAIRRGYADVVAGRTKPASDVLAELRQKLGLPA